MRTTMLIVEFLVGGALLSLALIVCVVSFFPDEIQMIFHEVQVFLSDLGIYESTFTVFLLFSTVFVAVAYTVGVFSEFIAREAFEWLFIRVKKKSVKKYLKNLRDCNVNLTKDPILRGLEEYSPKKSKKGCVKFLSGLMRFHVLMKSPELYQDIASQLHRFRLMRILFLAEVFLMVAIIRQLLRGFSSSLMVALVLLTVIAIMNAVVIYDRFKRYNRSIERSYTVLMLDKYGLVEDKEPA